MRSLREYPDLTTAIWQAGREATEEIQRKAKRPRLLRRPKSRKRCEEKTQDRIDGLLARPTTAASRAELTLIRRGCVACGKCKLG